MNFRQDYPERNKGPNLCDEIFLKYAKTHKYEYRRFGYDESKENRIESSEFNSLSLIVRKKPDYIIKNEKKHYFIECKLGAYDGLKLKDCDMIGYEYWNNQLIIFFFVYFPSFKKIKIVKYCDMLELTKGKERFFMPDNKEPYCKILYEEMQ